MWDFQALRVFQASYMPKNTVRPFNVTPIDNHFHAEIDQSHAWNHSTARCFKKVSCLTISNFLHSKIELHHVATILNSNLLFCEVWLFYDDMCDDFVSPIDSLSLHFHDACCAHACMYVMY